MRAFTLLLLVVLASFSSAQQKVYRAKENPMTAFFQSLSPAKQKRQAALFKKYAKDNPRYTKEILSLLSRAERRSYIEMIKAMQRHFLKSHPEVDPMDIETIGGYGIRTVRPKSKV